MNGKETMDVYAQTAELIGSLKAAGLEAEGNVLREVVDSGSTGTEIFMALRWHLEGLLKNGLPDDLRAKISELEAFLALALR